MNWALWTRFLAWNILFFAGFGYAFQEGWIMPFLDNLISWGIVALYGVGLVICGNQIFRTSKALNQAKAHPLDNPMRQRFQLSVQRVGIERAMRALELRLGARKGVIGFICELLVILGLVGTALGFWLTFQSLDLTIIDTSEGLKALAGAIDTGFRLAMTTTVAGIVAAMALGTFDQMLGTGTAKLEAAILDDQ